MFPTWTRSFSAAALPAGVMTLTPCFAQTVLAYDGPVTVAVGMVLDANTAPVEALTQRAWQHPLRHRGQCVPAR